MKISKLKFSSPISIQSNRAHGVRRTADMSIDITQWSENYLTSKLMLNLLHIILAARR